RSRACGHRCACRSRRARSRRGGHILRGGTPVQRIPIRMKLAAALAVPLLALFVRTGVEVADRAREVGELRSQAALPRAAGGPGGPCTDLRSPAALARAAVGPGGLINRLQDESTWTVIDLTGATGGGVHAPVESYEATRRATDEALAGLRAEVESGGEAVAAAYAPARARSAEGDRRA